MTNMKDDLLDWVQSKAQELDFDSIENLVPLREQASLRTYFRINTNTGTKIGVISQPLSEENELFQKYSRFLISHGIKAPRVEAADHKKGLMLLEDFGDKVLQLEINARNKESFYKGAIKEVNRLQTCDSSIDLRELSEDDLKDQMKLFEEWFIFKLLGLSLSDNDKQILHDAWDKIAFQCSHQSYTLCHFDFEFRNLMLLPNNNIGILDFQDMCMGPYALDLSSILMDIENPLSDQELEDYLKFYNQLFEERDENRCSSLESLRRDLDYAGFQRQFRILGTLSRLHIRDNKSFRLPDLLQTLKYLQEGSLRYKELEMLGNFLTECVEPELKGFLKARI